MILQKGEKIREGKKYEPSNVAKAWTLSELVQKITSKNKNTLRDEFSRKGLKLSNIQDVKNYIENRYKSKFL